MRLCHEMKWRPCDVDDLLVGEFFGFCNMIDEIERERKKSSRG